MEFLPILIVIWAVVGLCIYARKRSRQLREAAAKPVPKPEELYVPSPNPEPEPVPQPVRAVVLFEDSFRNVKVCPRCDGENDQRAAQCRICGGRL